MADYPALPLWTDAYLADTIHLSTLENGAYLKLLMVAWRTPECALPDDDVLLARWTGLDRRSWNRIKPTIMAFFSLENGMWRQKRLTKEREYLASSASKRAEAGRVGGLASAATKSLKNNSPPQAMLNDCSSNRQAPTPTPTPIPIASLRSENGESLTPAPAQAHAREAGEAGQSGKSQNPYDQSFQVSAKVIWGREVLGILGYDWNHYEAVGKNYGLLFRLEAEGFSQDDITEAARRVVLGWGGNQPTDKNNPLRYFERGLRENLASITVKEPEPTNVVPIERPKVPINRPISKEEDDAYYENIRRNRLRAEEYLRNRSSLSIKEVLRS